MGKGYEGAIKRRPHWKAPLSHELLRHTSDQKWATQQDQALLQTAGGAHAGKLAGAQCRQGAGNGSPHVGRWECGFDSSLAVLSQLECTHPGPSKPAPGSQRTPLLGPQRGALSTVGWAGSVAVTL